MLHTSCPVNLMMKNIELPSAPHWLRSAADNSEPNSPSGSQLDWTSNIKVPPVPHLENVCCPLTMGSQGFEQHLSAVSCGTEIDSVYAVKVLTVLIHIEWSEWLFSWNIESITTKICFFCVSFKLLGTRVQLGSDSKVHLWLLSRILSSNTEICCLFSALSVARLHKRMIIERIFQCVSSQLLI